MTPVANAADQVGEHMDFLVVEAAGIHRAPAAVEYDQALLRVPIL